MSLLDSEFRADRLNVHNLKLNGIDISNFQIETLGDGKYIDSMRGDIKVQITPSMLDASGNYVIQQIPGFGRFVRAEVKLNSSYGMRDIDINGEKIHPKLSSPTLSLIKSKYKPDYIKQVGSNFYYKIAGDNNVYLFVSETESTIVTNVTMSNKDKIDYTYTDTWGNRFILIPLAQFRGLGASYTLEFKVRTKDVVDSSLCWLHFSKGDDNRYPFWGDWTGDQFVTFKFTRTDTSSTTKYYVNDVLQASSPYDINFSVIDRDLCIGADRDGPDIFNNLGRVQISYIKFFDGSGNLVTYYNFVSDSMGGALTNKGSWGGSATNSNTTPQYNLPLPTASDMYYTSTNNLKSNTLTIKPSRTDFTTINLDLWLEQ